MKTVMIIVGTTNFDDLIKEIDQEKIYKIFKKFGFKKIIFQIGKGVYLPKNYEKEGFEGIFYDYKANYEEDIDKSDFIIGHGGAGTILDCLRKDKKLMVVINNSLMNNHQFELFDELVKEGYLFGLQSPSLLEQNVF